MPAIFPYFTNQRCFVGFHLPPASLACASIEMSAASIRSGTRVSALYRGGGGVHSVLSTINSTVFSLCHNFASYLKRTHSNASPYFSTRFLVPRCPGLSISRVFTQTLWRRLTGIVLNLRRLELASESPSDFPIHFGPSKKK